MNCTDNFQLVEVNLFSLPEPYYSDFIKHTNRGSNVGGQMFECIISWIFHSILWFDETIAYNMILDKLRENQDCIENNFRKDWFIYDGDHKFVGTFGLRTHDPQSGFLYIGKRVLEISATITDEYRGKGIVKKLAPEFVIEMKREFPEDMFVLSTHSNNAIVSHLATINGFKKVHTYTDYIAFIPIQFDLYILE